MLQGESLLNHAVALMVFGLSLSVGISPGDAGRPLLPRLLIAVPGGVLLGILPATPGMRVFDKVAGTLSLVIVEFLFTYGTWIVAERLGLSLIVAVVALAAVVARHMPSRTSARDRVNGYTVWAAVVFSSSTCSHFC